MMSGHTPHISRARRRAAAALGLLCFLTVACSRRHEYIRTENPQPDLEVRINGRPMIVRSAIFFVDGVDRNFLFSRRAVNCDEIDRREDFGGDDVVEVGVFGPLDNIVALLVGNASAGRTIREPKIKVTEATNPGLYPDSATGTIDVATTALEIRGTFTARGCGPDLRVLSKKKSKKSQ